MDVYVDKKPRVWLLDFSAFGGVTDPALFEWEEVLHHARRQQRGTTSAHLAAAVDGPRDTTDAPVESASISDVSSDVHTLIAAVPASPDGLYAASTVIARCAARRGIAPRPLMRHQLPDDVFQPEFAAAMRAVTGSSTTAPTAAPPASDIGAHSVEELIEMMKAAGCGQ